MHNNDKPNYFAVIPAGVRYDKNICPNAKLLYAEITALSNLEGYCWASNKYFTNLYSVNERSVQNWLSSLQNAGYISVSFEYIPGTSQVCGRKIFLAEAAAPPAQSPAPPPPIAPQNPTPEPPAPAAATPQKPAPQSASPAAPGPVPPTPTPDSPRGENFFTTPPKIYSPPGENFFTHNSITTNNITTTAYSSDPPVRQKQQPAPEIPHAAAAEKFTADQINAACLKLDPRLAFSQDFYPNAASFMSKNNLDPSFLAWLYSFCQKKNPKSITGLFFSLFSKPSVLQLFRADLAPVNRSPPQPPPRSCPVCGSSVPHKALFCPSCSFSAADFTNNSRVAAGKALRSLSPDQRSAYERDAALIFQSSLDFNAKSLKLTALSNRYGIPSSS